MAEKKIVKSDVSEEDIFIYITESAKKSEKALDSYNAKLNETAKVIKLVSENADPSKLSGINAIINAEKELTKIKNDAVKTDKEKQRIRESVKAYEDLIKEVKKKEEAEIKRAKTEEKLHAQREKQYNKEIQQQEKASSLYAKVDAKLAGMVRTYRELAIRKELGVKLSEKEQRTMDFLADKITKYDTAIKTVDASSGRFQRNVGNYKSGFDGMTFSVTQLAREMPAFANSVQTGFMAISNNLPMFFDEIQKLKQANIELAKSGEPTKSVFKSLAGSLMSTQVLLSVGVTLLTLYGSKLVEFVGSLFQANKEVDRAAQYQRQLNKERKDGIEFVATESAEFIGNINALRQSNANSKERARMIDLINEKYGTTLKNLKDEKEFQNQLNKEVGNYLELQIKKYEAQRNEERIVANLKKQEELREKIRKGRQAEIELQKEFDKAEKEMNSAQNRVVTGGGSLGGTGAGTDYQQSFEKRYYEARKLVKENKKQLEQDIKDLETIKKRLQTYDVDPMLDPPPGAEKGAKHQKELRTEIEYTNDYISEQIKLLRDLNEIENSRMLDRKQSEIQDYYMNLMKTVNETGQLNVDVLESLIHEKMTMEKNFIDAKTAYEIQQLEYVYNAEFVQRRKSLDEKYRDLLAQENLTAQARTEIEANYNKALEELDNEELARYKDLETKKTLLLEKSKEDKKAIEKEAQSNTSQMNDELIQAQIEFYKKDDELRKKAIEEEKRIAEERKKIAKDVRDSLERYGDELMKREIDRSKQRQDIMQRELSTMQQREQQLRDMANSGNISAQQSLAVSEQLSLKKQQQIDKEAKKQQAWETAKIAYKAVFDFMEKGDSLPIATLKGTTGAMTMQALFKSLFGFRKGTKTTVANELGAPLMSGDDGYIARVDGREKILNPELSALTGNATTDEIVRGFLMSQNGLMVNLSNGKSVSSDRELLSKIDELKTVIRNKTEFHLSEEVRQGIARGLVVTEKNGINRNRTFYRQ